MKEQKEKATRMDTQKVISTDILTASENEPPPSVAEMIRNLQPRVAAWNGDMDAGTLDAIDILSDVGVLLDALAVGWQPIATLPRDGTRVLAYFPSGFARVECFNAHTIPRATHWMPLPEPPRADPAPEQPRYADDGAYAYMVTTTPEPSQVGAYVKERLSERATDEPTAADIAANDDDHPPIAFASQPARVTTYEPATTLPAVVTSGGIAELTSDHAREDSDLAPHQEQDTP